MAAAKSVGVTPGGRYIQLAPRRYDPGKEGRDRFPSLVRGRGGAGRAQRDIPGYSAAGRFDAGGGSGHGSGPPAFSISRVAPQCAPVGAAKHGMVNTAVRKTLV